MGLGVSPNVKYSCNKGKINTSAFIDVYFWRILGNHFAFLFQIGKTSYMHAILMISYEAYEFEEYLLFNLNKILYTC